MEDAFRQASVLGAVLGAEISNPLGVWPLLFVLIWDSLKGDPRQGFLRGQGITREGSKKLVTCVPMNRFQCEQLEFNPAKTL